MNLLTLEGIKNRLEVNEFFSLLTSLISVESLRGIDQSVVYSASPSPGTLLLISKECPTSQPAHTVNKRNDKLFLGLIDIKESHRVFENLYLFLAPTDICSLCAILYHE